MSDKAPPHHDGERKSQVAIHIVELIMAQHWDMAACPCWICTRARAADMHPWGHNLESANWGRSKSENPGAKSMTNQKKTYLGDAVYKEDWKLRPENYCHDCHCPLTGDAPTGLCPKCIDAFFADDPEEEPAS